MTEDEMNPNICPSALQEDGTLDRTMGEDWGKHKFFPQLSSEDYKKPDIMCEECGATYDPAIHTR